MQLGVDTLPEFPKDAGDRNRTSPFAFTGNKFEFRAVGSSFSISDPLTALNTIVADSLEFIAGELEKATKGAGIKDEKKFNAALQKLLKDILAEHGDIIFNGNGYSKEWHEEAEKKRGLKNLRTSPEAFGEISAKSTVDVFKRQGVAHQARTRVARGSRLPHLQSRRRHRVQAHARNRSHADPPGGDPPRRRALRRRRFRKGPPQLHARDRRHSRQ